MPSDLFHLCRPGSLNNSFVLYLMSVQAIYVGAKRFLNTFFVHHRAFSLVCTSTVARKSKGFVRRRGHFWFQSIENINLIIKCIVCVEISSRLEGISKSLIAVQSYDCLIVGIQTVQA